MFENFTKTKAYAILAGTFCALIMMSNILAAKTINYSFIILPCSIITFPALFIVNDLLSEIYGFKMAKMVIYLGFILNLFGVICYTIAIILPSTSPNSDAFTTILGTTPRLLFAGLCSYISSNIVNSKVLVKLKEKYYHLLFVRCMLSTAVGQTVDTVIFITVGFYGVLSLDLMINMIICLTLFNILYEFISYPLTRKVVLSIRKLDDGELKGQINQEN